MPSMGAFQANTKRETGKKAQQSNIQAAKAVSDIVRTTLGPRAMLKMLLDANAGIVLTNDGNAILREIDVSHPAAKSMIELSRTQDEEVGDGTTSVIILAGEMLHVAEPFLERNLHPTQIVRGYHRALEDAKKIVDEMAFPVDITDRGKMLDVISSCIDTKFTHRFGPIMSELALDAVRTVVVEMADGQREIDIKKYAKIEKIPGGDITECRVLKGVMFQKDVVSPDRMRRRIVNPRILLLDCPLEYKKGENQTNIELAKEEDWQVLMRMEEEWIQGACESIIAHKPDVVVTEKGLSDLAAHYLQKAGISAVRRLRKTDNNRIARATGATIVNRPEEIRASDIGTKAGLFEVKKIGDEFFCFIVDCQDPKACSVLLRGASKDMLNEVERNLHDAMGVARNIMQNPKMVPGGGVCEIAISQRLSSMANSVEGVERGPYEAIGKAMEVIPRTLAQNCGANVIRTLTELRARHSSPGCTMGIDGNTGKITDMKELGIWEPQEVKMQSMKTAVEAAILLLRIDDIVSGMKKSGRGPGPSPQGPRTEDPEDVDSERALPE